MAIVNKKILVIQFFGAMIVIKPSLIQFSLCMVVLVFGIGLFGYLAKVRKI